MQQEQDLKTIDKLIAGFGGSSQSDGPLGLLLEHLQAARRGLLSAASGEYGFSLEQAQGSLACISDKTVRVETKKTLQSLIDAKRP